MRKLFAAAAISLSIAGYANAGEKGLSQSVAVFGGFYVVGGFPGDVNVPFLADFESNYIVGASYSRDFVDLGHDFYLGAEAGLAARFGAGEVASAELWGGASLRHAGVTFGPVTIASRFVAGLSAVTNTIGAERGRVFGDRDATLLFYLGPEIDFSFESDPKTEYFFRTQHRSGGYGTLGNMVEGHNANVFGIRRSF